MEKNAAKQNLLFLLYVFLIFCFFIISFILIANEMSRNKLAAFDNQVIGAVQSQISPVLTDVMLTFTFLGSVKWLTFAVLAGTLFLFIKRKWSLGIFFVLSSGVGSLFNVLLKNIFKRQRPDLHRLITETSYSFPSGHSMGSFIFYGAIAYIILHYARKKSAKTFGIVLMALFILFIGISRIYLGVHYPSDVVGGYTAGGAWLSICIIGFRYYEHRRKL
ncbi:phosphatase PAP2 family protein [Neobacillus sp. SM06]|uniref:phosphatase PAP2 family protein n=1 Tax=Neobacillus sp. SM06 TaxID=3422492 RepID=UPI003D2B7698